VAHVACDHAHGSAVHPEGGSDDPSFLGWWVSAWHSCGWRGYVWVTRHGINRVQCGGCWSWFFIRVW